VTDVLEERLAFIRAFGATDTINVRERTDAEIIQEVRKLTNGFGVDCALEVAGVPEVIPTGLKCLRTGGRYIEIGNSFPTIMMPNICKWALISWRRAGMSSPSRTL
jgi:threonine dehydrogenase-like Zn-dependent dehydrogenase